VGLQTQIQKAATAEANPPLVATATAVAHIEVRRSTWGSPEPMLAFKLARLHGGRASHTGADCVRPQNRLQVVRCPPRLGQLRELLAACRPYGLDDEGAEAAGRDSSGGDDAMSVDGLDGAAVGFTTGQLEDLVQASRSELLRELKALNALQLGGRWRLVDEDYLGRLLEVVLLRWGSARVQARRFCCCW
jgi:hypothetical protein